MAEQDRPINPETLSPELAREFAVLRDRFASDWRAGARPQIPDFLSQIGGNAIAQEALFVELLHCEINLRLQSGEEPNAAEYCERFPERAALVRQAFASGGAPATANLSPPNHPQADTHIVDRCLRIRCPHCQHAIEIIDVDPLREIECPSCHSSFSLIGRDAALMADRSIVRRIAHFELIEQLGMGAFGSVWKARDVKLDRIVAVKIPRRAQLDFDNVEMFFREARAAAQLRHPHIVSVHEVGRDGDTVYIVSELVSGVNLSDWLADQRPTPREAATLCAQVATALHHAHESGVIHRDLKLGNIMLDADGQTHIMDFGLAKREAGEITMTVEGRILGTPAYMSPEQARGEGHQADRRTDVYSLGVILFQLLTRELPFRGTPRMLLHQVLNDEPRSPRSLNDRIPRDLETICLKAMAKEPARRYATALAMADDLRRFLRDEPILARPVGRLERLWRWRRRNPLVAALASAVALILLLGTAVSSYFAVDAAAQARDALFARDVADKKTEEAERNLAESNRQRQRADEQAKQARASELQARRLLYASDLNSAQQNWDENKLSRAVELLKQQEPKPNVDDLRGWEWGYLHALCHSELRTFHGHLFGATYSLAFSPHEQRLATADGDNTVKLWDVATGKNVATLNQHSASILRIAFSPDGRRIASASADRSIKIWDVEKRAEFVTLRGHTESVTGVAFSPDGERIASSSTDRTIKVWNLERAAEPTTFKAQNESLTSVAFSPDGRRIATTSYDKSVTLWDATTGEQLRSYLGHGGETTRVAFSPDGRLLASASGDGAIKLWDTSTNANLATLTGHAGAVRDLAFSSDGRRIVSGGDDTTIRIWDVESRSEITTLKGHLSTIWAVAISPGGEAVASSSLDNTVKLWDAQGGGPLRALKNQDGPITRVTFTPDGKALVSTAINGTITLRHVDDCMKIASHKAPAGVDWNVVVSPDGGQYATTGADKTLKLWRTETGAELATLATPAGAPSLVVFSSNGHRLAALTGANTITVWDAIERRELATLKNRATTLQRANVTQIALNADGSILATVSADRSIKLWHVDRGELLATLKGDGGSIASLAFSADSRRIASANMDMTVRVWDTKSGNQLGEFKGHTAYVNGVAFSPDGSRIASTSFDQTLKFWDAETGSQLASIKTPSNALGSVAFSPDGKRVAAAGDTVYLVDATVRTDDAKTARFFARRLFDRYILADDVVAAIQRVDGWNQPMREAGLAYASNNANTAANIYQATWDDIAEIEPFTAPRPKWERVGAIAQALVGKEPENPRFRRLLALANQQLGEGAKALEALPAVSTQDAAEAVLRSIICLAQDRGDEAVRAAKSIRVPEAQADGAPQALDLVERQELRYARDQLIELLYRKLEPKPPTNKPRDWPALATLMESAIALGAHHPDAFSGWGDALAMQGKWQDAADAYAKAVEASQSGWNELSSWALLQLAAGNTDGYRSASAELLKRHGDTNDSYAAYWVALTCVVADGAPPGPDMERILALARKAADAEPSNPIPKTALGAAQLRAGQKAAAITTLTTALPQHALAEFAAPKELDYVRVSRLLGEAALARAYRDDGGDVLEKQRAKLRNLIEKLEMTPQQFSEDLAPWAIPFALRMAKDELAQ